MGRGVRGGGWFTIDYVVGIVRRRWNWVGLGKVRWIFGWDTKLGIEMGWDGMEVLSLFCDFFSFFF